VLEENILSNKNYFKNTRQKKKNYKLLIFFFLKNKAVKVKFLETKINNKQLFFKKVNNRRISILNAYVRKFEAHSPMTSL
jgi:hypothetical protein